MAKCYDTVTPRKVCSSAHASMQLYNTAGPKTPVRLHLELSPRGVGAMLLGHGPPLRLP